MSQSPSFKRSSVTKILAAELTRTTHAMPKSEQQYEAQTYLSPAGRTITKVMICGTAVEKEDVGKDSSLWRLRISDPSGTVQIYAGMYQSEAAAVISQLEVPCFVSVVGKLNIYEPEDGSHIVSIRPDSVTVIDSNGKTRDDFVLDAALSTIRGINKITDEKMKEVAAIYGDKADKDSYILVARQAIEGLLRDYNNSSAGREPEQPEAHKEKDAKPASPPAPVSTSKKKEEKKDKTSQAIDDSIKTVQEVLLEILKEKDTVKIDDVPGLLKARGINPNMVDWTSAVKRLMNEGQCFEPKVGTLRYSEA